jgi:50S ribosomal protein L16 3-hydroxylase
VFQFPGALTAEDFLDRHWQKSPLYMPGAIKDALPELTADELAWLATLGDVESRLVFIETVHGRVRYRLEDGPFDEDRFARLPSENWTLLVQDVDKHLPVFRKFFAEIPFVPDWRIDDLMISFAAPGGSVGPHRDFYDVFLCQGAGTREWRIAARDAGLAAAESGDLCLLEPFEDDSPVNTKLGDVLYLPPGIPHWGMATEPCVTCSIGMRAPSHSEIIRGLERVLESVETVEGNEALWYRDPDLTASESEPGRISDRAIERAGCCFPTVPNLNGEDLVMAFGSVVTELKAWLTPEAPEKSEIDEFLASGISIMEVHGMARLAWYAGNAGGFVFANGSGRSVSTEELALFRQICAERAAAATSSRLLRWLLSRGAFDLP